jgi:tetratricopeptide (TPR) repeat protein
MHRCLWEIYCAVSSNDSKTKLVIDMPDSQRESFREGIIKHMGAAKEALSQMDAEKSEAGRAEDRIKIHEAIAKSEQGFAGLNHSVRAKLRKWYVDNIATLAQEALTDDREDRARALNNLAVSMSGFGGHDEALELLQRQLASFHPENHSDIAATCNNMANIYEKKGKQGMALEHYERALRMYDATAEQDRVNIAKIHSNMAAIFLAQEDYERAEQFYLQALNIKRADLGEQDPSMAVTYSGLANFYDETGQHDKAREYHQRALGILQHKVGDPHLAGIYHHLAFHHKVQNQHNEAVEYFDRALRIEQATLGEDHEDVAGTFDCIADVLADRGDFDKALLNHQKALQIRLAKFGENSDLTACSYFGVAEALLELKNYESALAHAQHALAIHNALLEEQRAETEEQRAETEEQLADTHDLMGRIYSKTKKNLTTALDHYQLALDIYDRTVGEGDERTMIAHKSLGIVLQELGRFPKAEDHLRVALTDMLSVVPQPDEGTAKVCEKLAEVYLAQNNVGEALAHFEKSLAILKLIVTKPPKPASLFKRHLHLADLYEQQQLFKKASEHYEECLTVNRDLAVVATPPSSPESSRKQLRQQLAHIHCNLARAYMEQGEYSQARQQYETLLQLRLEMPGEQHIDTAAAYTEMGRVISLLGEHSQAMVLHEKALSILTAAAGNKHNSSSNSAAATANVNTMAAANAISNNSTVTTTTADVHRNMGDVLTAQGQYPEAMEHLELAQRLLSGAPQQQGRSGVGGIHNNSSSSSSGGSSTTTSNVNNQNIPMLHPALARVYDSMAKVFEAQNDVDKAMSYNEKALHIKLATHVNPHPSTAQNFIRSAAMLERQGEYIRALDSLQQALEIQQSTLGEERAETAQTLANMAAICEDRKEFSQALEYSRRALAIRVSVLGKQDNLTAKTQGSTGDLLCKVPGGRAEGCELLRQCVATLTKNLGADHLHARFYAKKLAEAQSQKD